MGEVTDKEKPTESACGGRRETDRECVRRTKRNRQRVCAADQEKPTDREEDGQKMKAADIKEALGLTPLPVEGGIHKQTYCSALPMTRADGSEGPAGTAIYYMLEEDTFSHMHRLTGDEIYHFYLGDAVELLELKPDGTAHTIVLGTDLGAGQQVQYLVRAGSWQGSRLKPGGNYALLGTTMCPGYTDDCYEHGDVAILEGQYPAAADLIKILCRDTV